MPPVNFKPKTNPDALANIHVICPSCRTDFGDWEITRQMVDRYMAGQVEVRCPRCSYSPDTLSIAYHDDPSGQTAVLVCDGPVPVEWWNRLIGPEGRM